MEKGKDCCEYSPTLKDDQIKNILEEKVCGGVYDEDVIRNRVKQVDVYEKQMIICFYEGEQYCVCDLHSS